MQDDNRPIKRMLMDEEVVQAFRDSVQLKNHFLLFYRCAMMEVETKFKVLNEEFALKHDRNPIESIKTRLKSGESILAKIKKKCPTMDPHEIERNIHDIAGIRVICSFPDDIYELAECLTKQDDVKLVETKDYIKNPKDNGYRSLHLIIEVPIFLQEQKHWVKVEIQLRTLAMDFWASLEHKVKYKKDIPEKMEDEIKKELAECAKISAQLDLRMEAVKNYLDNIT